MLGYWLLAGLLVSLVCVYLIAEHRDIKALAYFCKPASTLTVIATLLIFTGIETAFLQWVLLALICSLFGDIFLMLPNDRFIPGLVSFFLGHVAYTIAFTTGVSGMNPDLTWGLPILFSLGLLTYLWRFLGDLKIPVVFYAIVILTMLISTIERYQVMPTESSLMLLVGAAIFILSDTLIALDKFRGNVPWPLPAIIITYFVAQWLLVSGAIFL